MADVGYQASALRPAQAAGGSVGDFLALMKPRVMSLVVFTALRRHGAGAGQHCIRRSPSSR